MQRCRRTSGMFFRVPVAVWAVVAACAAAGVRADEASRPMPRLNEAAVEALDEANWAAAPIHDADGLAAWLAGPGRLPGNPLAGLSDAGRRRTLASVRFLARFVAMDTSDVEAELTMSQAYRVLSLFGKQTWITQLPEARIADDDDRAVDAWRKSLARAD